MTAARRADRVFSIVLLAFSVFVLFESWRMPRLQELGVEPMTAPGLTPALVGLVLLVLGLILFLRSWIQHSPNSDTPHLEVTAPNAAGLNGDEDSVDPATPTDEHKPSIVYKRVFYTLIIALVYALGLVGRVPFWLATALFVFSFVLLFERRPEQSLIQRLVVATTLGIVSSAIITGLFQEVFLVRLP